MSEFVTLSKEQKVDLFDKVLTVNENSNHVVFMEHDAHLENDVEIIIHKDGYKPDAGCGEKYKVGGYVDSKCFHNHISYEEACQRLENLL